MVHGRAEESDLDFRYCLASTTGDLDCFCAVVEAFAAILPKANCERQVWPYVMRLARSAMSRR